MNYTSLVEFLEEIAEAERTDVGATASGFLKSIQTFDMFFALKLLCKIFSLVDTTNTALQSTQLHYQIAAQLILTLSDTVTALRDPVAFDKFWDETVQEATNLAVEEPMLPRIRRIPRRLDDGAAHHVFRSSKDVFRQRYNEVVDCICEALRDRFGGVDQLTKVEQFVIGKVTDEQVVTGFYGDDFDAGRLKLHRDMFHDVLRARRLSVNSLDDVVGILKADETLRLLIPEFTKLLKLALTICVTTATAERSFSALRRLKTFLRSTMSQERLNHAALLHVHRDLALSPRVNLKQICNEFILKNTVRGNSFALFDED